jgi:hypothetical protein
MDGVEDDGGGGREKRGLMIKWLTKVQGRRWQWQRDAIEQQQGLRWPAWEL